MEFELGNIANIGNEIITSEQQINRSFNSDWNDDVHESFYEFVSSFEREAKAISDLITSFPSIVEPLKKVDASKLNEECENLLSLIEGI